MYKLRCEVLHSAFVEPFHQLGTAFLFLRGEFLTPPARMDGHGHFFFSVLDKHSCSSMDTVRKVMG